MRAITAFIARVGMAIPLIGMTVLAGFFLFSPEKIFWENFQTFFVGFPFLVAAVARLSRRVYSGKTVRGLGGKLLTVGFITFFAAASLFLEGGGPVQSWMIDNLNRLGEYGFSIGVAVYLALIALWFFFVD